MSRSAALHLCRHAARGRPHNPEYKSRDVKKINDPEFVDNDSVYTLDSFGLIGLGLWQLKGGTIFDHIIIADDKVKADSFTTSRSTLISTVISISTVMYNLINYGLICCFLLGVLLETPAFNDYPLIHLAASSTWLATRRLECIS